MTTHDDAVQVRLYFADNERGRSLAVEAAEQIEKLTGYDATVVFPGKSVTGQFDNLARWLAGRGVSDTELDGLCKRLLGPGHTWDRTDVHDGQFHIERVGIDVFTASENDPVECCCGEVTHAIREHIAEARGGCHHPRGDDHDRD